MKYIFYLFINILSYIDNGILIKCIKNSSLKENEVKIREI